MMREYLVPPSGATAQRNELLGFKTVIRHCLQHHDGTLPTSVIAIDYQYVYKIVTGTATAADNLEDWEEIWDMLSRFAIQPLVKHTKSHQLETDPVHEIIDKLLEDPLRSDVVLAVKTVDPKTYSDPFLTWLHEHWGHPGPKASHLRWWSTTANPTPYGTQSDWEHVSRACKACAKEKCYRTKHQVGALDARHLAPGKVWQVELLGPLPGAKPPSKGLAVVDLGTRQLQVIPLRKSNATAVITALTTVFATWQAPKEIQSDGGPPFNSVALDKFARLHNVTWHLHLPYHPQSNGVIERRIGLYKEQLRL
ncbi:hypothetical protein Y1Q_0014182 [Alligator mississippiensis]|uniref:Integrase catalytic domain-containing protein n=1 Tax=Alligator mississippiensis TaxID=8496 RepID=A0A151MU13_ALLMI|nr:hypothetical protein Y1Q_0014182 [Alligator mississippiensis]